ncbi:MAG: hypothetical protein QNI87_01990 [Erythrobacter sp.]|nr:hypothetical protein [Erythrobacter sp.]MDJ0977286.1 hypothetical protein [Erythrobacter sp.]
MENLIEDPLLDRSRLEAPHITAASDPFTQNLELGIQHGESAD